MGRSTLVVCRLRLGCLRIDFPFGMIVYVCMLCYAMDRGTDLLDGFDDHNDTAFERVSSSLRRWGYGLYLQLDLTLSLHETNLWIF
jgi:hypothetical protein